MAGFHLPATTSTSIPVLANKIKSIGIKLDGRVISQKETDKIIEQDFLWNLAEKIRMTCNDNKGICLQLFNLCTIILCDAFLA